MNAAPDVSHVLRELNVVHTVEIRFMLNTSRHSLPRTIEGISARETYMGHLQTTAVDACWSCIAFIRPSKRPKHMERRSHGYPGKLDLMIMPSLVI